MESALLILLLALPFAGIGALVLVAILIIGRRTGGSGK